MLSLNCFSSSSNEPPNVGAGASGSVGHQNGAGSHNRLSGWSMCCGVKSQISSLFSCIKIGLPNHHGRKRRPSFNRDRRVSFPDLNATTASSSASVAIESKSTSNQPLEMLQNKSESNSKSETAAAAAESEQALPQGPHALPDDMNRQSNILNCIRKFVFFTKRRKSHPPDVYNPSHPPHHPNHQHSMLQLSVSSLVANNSYNINNKNKDCDTIKHDQQQQSELSESNDANNVVKNSGNNLIHNQLIQQQQQNIVPCSSKSNNCSMVDYIANNNSNKCLINNQETTTTASSAASSFSANIMAKTMATFKSKKLISPTISQQQQQTSSSGSMIGVGMNPEQHQLRMNVSAKRLMKEISDLMHRRQTKQLAADFSVELIDDSLYEWYIKIYEFDNESQIHLDMQEYQIPFVQLHAIFPETYPFDPPFIRVVAPYIERGYIMEGGAICLELLTKTGWTSAYTMESVVVQLMASFVKGQATIKATKDVSKCFTKKSAVNSFRHIVRIHDKHGWVDTPLYEG